MAIHSWHLCCNWPGISWGGKASSMPVCSFPAMIDRDNLDNCLHYIPHVYKHPSLVTLQQNSPLQSWLNNAPPRHWPQNSNDFCRWCICRVEDTKSKRDTQQQLVCVYVKWTGEMVCLPISALAPTGKGWCHHPVSQRTEIGAAFEYGSFWIRCCWDKTEEEQTLNLHPVHVVPGADDKPEKTENMSMSLVLVVIVRKERVIFATAGSWEQLTLTLGIAAPSEGYNGEKWRAWANRIDYKFPMLKCNFSFSCKSRPEMWCALLTDAWVSRALPTEATSTLKTLLRCRNMLVPDETLREISIRNKRKLDFVCT